MEISFYERHRDLFKYFSTGVHVFAALHYTSALFYDYSIKVYIFNSVEQNYHFRMRYLTYWNLYFQWFYFTCRALNDVLKPRNEEENNRWLDLFQAAIAFPLAMFVCSMYWFLVFIDENLVSSGYSNINNEILDHMIHTNIVLFQLLDYMTTRRSYSSTLTNILVGYFLVTVYLIVMIMFYFALGDWTYPIFGKLLGFKRILFGASCYMCLTFFIYFGEIINTVLWGRPRNEETIPNGQ